MTKPPLSAMFGKNKSWAQSAALGFEIWLIFPQLLWGQLIKPLILTVVIFSNTLLYLLLGLIVIPLIGLSGRLVKIPTPNSLQASETQVE
jgi:hypothetical protein